MTRPERGWSPRMPPDFVSLRGAGCCRDCGMDDGPLYKGDLCRWCWQLAEFPLSPVQRKLRKLRNTTSTDDPEILVALVLGIVIWLVLLANILLGT